MSATAKMIVCADGTRVGTVGGGCLEGEIIERALDAIERRKPAISEHTLASEFAGDYGLTCGGTATIVVEPLIADDVLAAVYAACVATLARGGRATMVTSLDWSDGPQKVLLSGDDVVGEGAEALRMAGQRLERGSEAPLLVDGYVVEPVRGAPRVVIFGGGHVGANIARAATFAGWRATVADDRPEYADEGRHPTAERTVVCDFDRIPPTLAIDGECYVVVATRGHQHDALLMDQLVRMQTRYLGMLGSRRKVALTWRLLDQWGAPRDGIARARAPIGLSIGADTPEEIAVSVVAEMIAVRRAGNRRRGGAMAAGRADGGHRGTIKTGADT